MVCIFIFSSYFLFLNCFYFQNIRILKSLTSYFLFSRNINTQNLLYIDFFSSCIFILPEISFLFSIENTNVLFSFSSCFQFSFSLKMFSEIQLNTFLLPFFIFSKNENKKQSNQTVP